MKWMRALAFGVVSLIAATGVAAQDDYPNRYVRIVVPFTPGGIVDNIARVLADKLQSRLGQPVVVENKAGAGGAIGTSFVAASKSDGYTLLLASPSHAVLPSLNKSARWDPTKDFRAIAGIGIVPNVVVVHPDVPVKTLPELLERAKTHDVRYGTAGYGTSNHLSAELLAQMAGVRFTHVPYKGQPEAVTDLLGGQIEMMPLTTAIAAAHIETGKLRPLAVTTARRATALPDIPTVAEAAGLPGYEVGTWFGLVAPAGVPDPIVERLSAEVAAVLAMPDVQEKLEVMAMEIDVQSPDEFDEYVADEYAKWAKVMAAAGVTQK